MAEFMGLAAVVCAAATVLHALVRGLESLLRTVLYDLR
jgi:hypothetical protein